MIRAPGFVDEGSVALGAAKMHVEKLAIKALREHVRSNDVGESHSFAEEQDSLFLGFFPRVSRRHVWFGPKEFPFTP